MNHSKRINRRKALQWIGAGTASLTLPSPRLFAAAPVPILTKSIPSTDEKIPVIGMGTWQTFDVVYTPELQRARTQVLKTFFELGGGMVDCSPMYGSSADVLGKELQTLGISKSLFSAEKVWTFRGKDTAYQVNQQAQRWGVKTFDLMQVHNLLSWEAHLANLRELKQNGKIRYIGLTTSHGRRHGELEQAMKEDGIDFVQLTYNLTHREVEQRLLPLARERGIAVIVNRPYDGGRLIKQLKREKPIPDWTSKELGCRTWADVLLKFIVSHPAITCAIPATTQAEHMRENMMAGRGTLPDPNQRKRMVREIGL